MCFYFLFIFSNFCDYPFHCPSAQQNHRFCRLQSPTKWVETLPPKGAFWRFSDFQRGKYSFSSPIPCMQCCAAVRATFRKEQIPQLNGGDRGGVWILLFSGVTLFECNASSNQNNIPRFLPASPNTVFSLPGLPFRKKRAYKSCLGFFFDHKSQSLPFKAHACTGEISGGRFQANSFSRGKIPLKRQLFSR